MVFMELLSPQKGADEALYIALLGSQVREYRDTFTGSLSGIPFSFVRKSSFICRYCLMQSPTPYGISVPRYFTNLFNCD